MKMLRSVLLLLGLLVALTGCGGGGRSVSVAARGAASISVVWPNTGRVVPSTAAYVAVTVDSVTKILAKSASVEDPGVGGQSVTSATFGSQNVGTYGVSAAAYALSDVTATTVGSVTTYALHDGAVPLAYGTSRVTIVAGTETVFTVTMDTQLARYKIVETPDASGNYSFDDDNNPNTPFAHSFFLDANGIHAFALGGSPITFDALRTAATVVLTPQSGMGDLLLLPVSDTREFKLTVGGGFSFNTGGTSNPDGTFTKPLLALNGTSFSQAQVDLVYTPTTTSTGTLKADYSDFEGGDVQPLKSFAGTVSFASTSLAGSTSFTVAGLPSTYSASFYKVVGTLKEADLSSDIGATYSTESTTMTLAFTGVVNRGRNFTLSAKLQVKTVGGGYVDLTSTHATGAATLGSLPATLTFVSGDYLALSVPDQNAAAFKRGDGLSAGTFTTITGIQVAIGSGATPPTFILDPSLFDHPARATSTGVTGVVVTGTSPWTVKASSAALDKQSEIASFSATFKGGNPNVAQPSGTISVNITPNAGTVGTVGVG